ncbi:MAG: PepSY domain-containing protein, partial [Flavobacterium sp.]|nr:PepSY domain-containing protein [Flavobacterium sp.]
MVWAFTWFQAIVYVAGSGTTTPPDVKTEKSVVTKPGTISALDKTLVICREKYPSASAYNYGKPADATDVINVYIQQIDGAYYIHHNLQVDQYTGKLLLQRDHSAKNFG